MEAAKPNSAFGCMLTARAGSQTGAHEHLRAALAGTSSEQPAFDSSVSWLNSLTGPGVIHQVPRLASQRPHPLALLGILVVSTAGILLKELFPVCQR